LLIADAHIGDPLHLGHIVAVLVVHLEHSEAAAADGGDDGAAVARELVVADVEHAAVLVEVVGHALAVHAHAELAAAALDGAPQHEAVARLVDVEGAGRERQRQCAHEYGHFVVVAR